MLRSIGLAFIPLFVAVNAVGIIPIFMSLTDNLSRKKKIKIVVQSITTAACLSVGFLFLGRAVLRFLRISPGDFMVAGGILLFCIALIDIINPQKRKRLPGEDLGSVPLGTPLIAGPAVLTTSLVLLEEFGVMPTLVVLLANIALAGVVFLCADTLLKIMGKAGARALSKFASLLLAAIAIMMVRRGVIEILAMHM